MIQLINVELTPADADRFVAFQKHYHLIGLLENIGAFKLCNGTVEIHFNSKGEIESLDKREHFHA